ncbi:UNVERIFIED_CONTAM: hypothetical protein K2H54_060874 [Gekko kuhli]
MFLRLSQTPRSEISLLGKGRRRCSFEYIFGNPVEGLLKVIDCAMIVPCNTALKVSHIKGWEIHMRNLI